jgi:hypothetical protein
MEIRPNMPMNQVIQLLMFNLFLLILSCGPPATDAQGEKVLYSAIDKTDTARLSIILTDKVFEGQYEISHDGIYKDSGDVNGVVKGDTLMGTFHYQSYGVEKWYRIPIALLKKDKQLIMGAGSMEIYMNMTFFSKKIPIDYQRPKFVFEKAN